LIIVLANKEDGAHVDPFIDPEHFEIAKANGSGFSFIGLRGVERPFGNPSLQCCGGYLMKF
jgi:hypothetical protein